MNRKLEKDNTTDKLMNNLTTFQLVKENKNPNVCYLIPIFIGLVKGKR